MRQGALLGMPFELLFCRPEMKAKLAHVEALAMELFRDRREVPRLKPTSAKLNRFNRFEL